MGGVSIDRCTSWHTVGYHAHELSSEDVFLQIIIPEWDLWSVGVIGPGLFRSGGHGPDVFNWRWRRGEVKGVLENADPGRRPGCEPRGSTVIFGTVSSAFTLSIRYIAPSLLRQYTSSFSFVTSHILLFFG